MTQKICAIIGECGCYFLSIVEACAKMTKKQPDIIELYNLCIKKRIMREDCFMWEPAKLFELLVGGNWTIEKVDGAHRPEPNETVILRYEYKPKPMTIIGHFVLAGSDGSVCFDPYGNSQTVQNGRVVSSRVFRRA